MKPSLTSRDLLAAAGVPTTDKPEIPTQYLPLLITSVIKLVSAKKFREALEGVGVTVSLREVNGWQHATREWLGLAEVGRGKPSNEYRKAVQDWLIANGNPSPEEIDAGWVPAHRRERNANQFPESFPKDQKAMEEFRMQVASLNAAKDDEDVRLLLSLYLDRVDVMELLDEKNWERHDVPPPSEDAETIGKDEQ